MIIIFPRESIKKLKYMVKTTRKIILVHLKLNIKKVTREEQTNNKTVKTYRKQIAR